MLADKIISILMAMAVSLNLSVPNESVEVPLRFDPNVDYMAMMVEVVQKGGDNALSEGKKLEDLRNEKLEWIGGSEVFLTDYFSGKYSVPEIRYEMGISKYIYTDADLNLLARLITAEAGCDWIPDWVKRDVGSVALNRMKSHNASKNLHRVIYQPGVYGCVNNGSINWRPTKSCLEAARYILDNGSTLPSYVTGQGPYQGTIYKSYYDSVLGTTIYFSY